MNSSPRSLQEKDQGRGRDRLPGALPLAGDPDGANRTTAHDPWELRRPRRQAVRELRAGPALLPGPRPSCPAPWLQSCTSSAGMAPIQNPFREQSTASRRSVSSEGQRRKRTHPLASQHRRTRVPERKILAPLVPIRSGGPGWTLCFLEEGSIGPSVPRPSDAFLSDAA